MDKTERFLRNISTEPMNKRARRRLMERELNKLYGIKPTKKGKDLGGSDS